MKKIGLGKIFWHFIFDIGPQRHLPSLQSWFFWHTTMGIFDHIWPLLHFRDWKWTITLHLNPSRPIWTIKKVIWSSGKQKMRIMQNSPFWQLWWPLTPKLSYRNTQKHFLRSQKILDPLYIGPRKGSGGFGALKFLFLISCDIYCIFSHKRMDGQAKISAIILYLYGVLWDCNTYRVGIKINDILHIYNISIHWRIRYTIKVLVFMSLGPRFGNCNMNLIQLLVNLILYQVRFVS